MMRFPDLLYIAVVLAWGWYPNGPLSVCSIAAWILHVTRGQPALHAVPLYLSIPLYIRGFVFGGMVAEYGWRVAAAILAVIGAFGMCAMHLVFPLSAKLPDPPGSTLPATLVFRLLDPRNGTDAMVRVSFPTKAVPGKEPKRLPWLLHGANTAAGYAYFMRMPSFIFSWMRFLPGLLFDADPETTRIPDPSDTIPEKFPVMVYSHGLGGTPDCYSTIVANAVSRGWVVFTPEHADGSAAFTQFSDGDKFIYTRLSEEDRKDEHKEYKFRHKQLKQRAQEVRSVIDFIYRSCGQKVGDLEPFKDDLRAQHDAEDENEDEDVASSNADDVTLVTLFLEGRMDHTRIVLAGHSFGAATVLAAAEKDTRVCGVIAHDPWMFPLSPATIAKGIAHVPVLSVCGDGFTVWPENANALRLLLSMDHRESHTKNNSVVINNAQEGYIPRNGVAKDGTVHKSLRVNGTSPHPSTAMFTIPGAEHQNFNDFAVLISRLLRMMKLIGPIDPHKFFLVLNELSFAFADAVILAGRKVKQVTFNVPQSVNVGTDVTIGPWTLQQARDAEVPR